MAMKRMMCCCAMVKLASTGDTPHSIAQPLHGGKFIVYPTAATDTGVQVIMHALKEVDSKGDPVGTQGGPKHSIETFAQQSWGILAEKDVELEGGVASVKKSFSTEVSNVGYIGVDTFIVKQDGDGDAGPPGEKWAVRVGDLYWNIRLWNWTFCDAESVGACRASDVGEFIELDISVKSRADAGENATVQDDKTVSLGGGYTLRLSSQVYKDDSDWVNMPAAYPQVSTQGENTTITFRFPKFANTVIYNSAITFDKSTTRPSPETSPETLPETSVDGNVAGATFASSVGFAPVVPFALMAAGRAQAAL